MNTWRKSGDQWLVQCDQEQALGATVTVTNRAGKTKQVTLGERINLLGFVYAVAPAQRETAAVGDMSGVLALFAKAKAHLKFPAIVLAVPELAPPGTLNVGVWTIRLSIAGDKARVPGSVTVTDGERTEDGRDWFGRILTDGTYQASNAANGRTQAITAALRRFAADPVTGAKESARLTGRCCFCNTALRDERSTEVGYGAICASHYGLPWGK